MTPNIPLLRKVVEWVEEQAALPAGEVRVWDQDSYFAVDTRQENWCGTVMCVAGKIAWDAGWRPAWGISDDELVDNWDTATVQRDGLNSLASDVARDLLGISSGSAAQLFAGDNNAAAIRLIAEDIVGERL